jgi:alpha-glucosidase
LTTQQATGTQSWWSNEVALSHHNVTFDGIWIDMSEVSSFCVGSCGSANLTQNPVGGRFTATLPTGYPEAFGVNNKSQAAKASSYEASVAAAASPTSTTTTFLVTTPTPGARNINYPPYAINNIYYDLAVHGAAPNATHQDELQTQEYDVHNLWGFVRQTERFTCLSSAFASLWTPAYLFAHSFRGSCEPHTTLCYTHFQANAHSLLGGQRE